MTDRELTELLRNNPDLQIGDPNTFVERYEVACRQAAGTKLSEHDLQVAVIAECDRRSLSNPLWGLIFAIPNGGQRTKAQGGRLKAEGVRAGVPDLFLPVARRGYHGMFIELKVNKNKTTAEQDRWGLRLESEGYCIALIYDDPAEVVENIEWYLEPDHA